MVEEWFYFISERMQHDFGRILYIQFQEEETDQPITPKIHDFIVGEEWCVYLSIDVIDEIEVWAEVGTDFKTDILRNPTRKFESTRESKVKKKLQSWAEIIPYLEKMGVDIDELNFSP
ncbi:MAG: hypothetical protein IH840_18310 [Candidatus Heimdallarchaeota archaeon]|nr:hypothetical protein [Candidatus Heimdallarchaeota archaeon]